MAAGRAARGGIVVDVRGVSGRRRVRIGSRHVIRGHALLELVMAMSLFGMALQVTMRTHLLQLTLMREIDQHRVALRALEARVGAESVKGDMFHDAGRRAGMSDYRRAHADGLEDGREADIVVPNGVAAQLASRLPAAQWIRQTGETHGATWTLCWRVGDRPKHAIGLDKDNDVFIPNGAVPDKNRRCESLPGP